MIKKFWCMMLMLTVSTSVYADIETTAYGKIVGIETRGEDMHVQTNFAAGSKTGCVVSVDDIYMYDFDASKQGDGAKFVQSVILAAFAAGKDVSFHLYECNSNNSRPIIGHVRVR